MPIPRDTDTSSRPPLRKPASMEMTPDEFDYYMKQAHRMRAEEVASMMSRLLVAVRRALRRGLAALRGGPRPQAPVHVAKQVVSRTS